MIDTTLIQQKKLQLETIKIDLKKYFVGIDEVIDRLVEYIQVWYLMPELLTRPVIVNLWGMTGVGKTDLVRKLVSGLQMQDRFCEVELSNIDTTSRQSSVSQVLGRNKLNDEKPAIVLFDEIQRFNTIDQDGKPLQQSKYVDFWELLSDGKLSKKEKDDLDYYISSFMYNKKDIQKRKEKKEENLEENPLVSHRQLQEILRMMNIEFDENTEYTEAQLLELIIKEKQKKKIYEPINHAKTLVIISGNLDEAFSMASQTSEADIDADIFHAFTTKITDVDIKNALSKKFRPEQVARFGNIHLIYKSLKKSDFEEIIRREIHKISERIHARFAIKLSIDKTMQELIYRNGVFPAQGVRPVFSSIIDIVETNLSNYLLESLIDGHTKISLSYDVSKGHIYCKLDDKKTILTPYIGRIDKIRNDNVQDAIANISVHECGHAVAYMTLTGLAPLQLKSKIASSYAGGFTFPHMVYETKQSLIDKAKILLSGGIAEELMFGTEYASVGRSHDREEVTRIIIGYIRKYGFDSEFQANYCLEQPHEMNKEVTDMDIEKMIALLVGETRELLSKQVDLLRDLSLLLTKEGSLEAPAIIKVAKKHKLTIKNEVEGFLKIYGYEDALINLK